MLEVQTKPRVRCEIKFLGRIEGILIIFTVNFDSGIAKNKSIRKWELIFLLIFYWNTLNLA